MMKKYLLIIALFTLSFGCQKKKEDPVPAVVQKQSVTPVTPEPKWKKMTTGERDALYLIQVLEYVKTENDKDIYSLKAYSNNNRSFKWEKTVAVWWENDEPKSDYFEFKSQGSGWLYNYTEVQNYWGGY